MERVYEAGSMAKYMEAMIAMVGKPGPCFLNVGIIAHNCFLDEELNRKIQESGTSDVFPIGSEGSIVTLNDVLTAWRAAERDQILAQVRNNGRSYFAEGFAVSADGRTIYMCWGS